MDDHIGFINPFRQAALKLTTRRVSGAPFLTAAAQPDSSVVTFLFCLVRGSDTSHGCSRAQLLRRVSKIHWSSSLETSACHHELRRESSCSGQLRSSVVLFSGEARRRFKNRCRGAKRSSIEDQRW
ncbi:hypothetical protein F2Q69_00004029 [Brassica cretica]|uniref:Uncharacterized protein n=1 Tax=Brassica cretica TaxID=69181 RepID=A0A8S9PPG4_BRACR|nr:hypothetical protein F2Q69_00004029 [Brassica cretica]